MRRQQKQTKKAKKSDNVDGIALFKEYIWYKLVKDRNCKPNLKSSHGEPEKDRNGKPAGSPFR